MNSFDTYYDHFISLGYSSDKASEMAILEVQADEISSAELNVSLQNESEMERDDDDYVPEWDGSNYPDDDYIAGVEGGYFD
jgi:hypothetical protein